MLCARPFRRGIQEFGCGQCWRCRVNSRRIWTLRLMLEGTQHEASSFVTLTYREAALPAGGTLVKRDLQLYFKRLRKAGYRFRYYAVGEYGEVTRRPHYHVLLFGVARPSDHIDWTKKDACGCVICATWALGHVHIGHDIAREALQYCAGYVTKRVLKADELGGRQPEFALMSRRPGIGYGAVAAFVDTFSRKEVAVTYERYEDTPTTVRTEGKFWPIGRYLRNHVGDALGLARGGRNTGRYRLAVPASHVLKLWDVLRGEGGRAAHEEKRLQHLRNAAVRGSIIRSRRGL